MERYRIFIVEDDDWYGELLEYHLSLNPDYEVIRFTTAAECLKNLHLRPLVVTLDYSLPDMNGDKVYQKIKNINPELPVVVISGQREISIALDLLKEGVCDYLVKDEDTKDRLWNIIKNIRDKQELTSQIDLLQQEVSQKYRFNKSIKGTSPAMRKIFDLMERAVKTNINVSITGETGTGKELVAKAVHYNSNRSKNNFVAVNLSAIPKELLESELFGYEKGAFTGAITRKIGKFEYANFGTIFLDEISEMDFGLQAKLLRVLQERELTRIGGNGNVKLDVKIITATNKDLSDEVRKGTFREDLYYRLLGLSIEMPALRERGNDILILAKHFVAEFCEENKIKRLNISAPAQEKLMKYTYPGNVRELRAIMDLACVMSNSDTINPEDITFKSPTSTPELFDKEMTLREYESKIISHFLEKYEGNVLVVAKKLDIGKSTIYRMIKNKELSYKIDESKLENLED